MKVKTITLRLKNKKFKKSYWYANMRNQMFEVVETELGSWLCVGVGREFDLIDKDDADIVPDEIIFATWLSENYTLIDAYQTKRKYFTIWRHVETGKEKSLSKIHKKWLKKFKTYKTQ